MAQIAGSSMVEPLLRDLLFTYALALGLILVLGRLRVPSIAALVAAGAVAGPTALGIVRTPDEVNAIAELGVVLLLFSVGLDFSLTSVRAIWSRVIAGGVLQLAGTAAVVAAAVQVFGLAPPRVGLFLGFLVGLSSTVIVLQRLSERGQVDSPHGRLAIGVLLLQDLSVVGLLLLVPMLSGQTSGGGVPAALGRAVLALAVVGLVGYAALPPFLRLAARAARREVFTTAIMVAGIGTAWVGAELGLGMPLGAFLAGLVLAESEFSHQILAEVRPLRDLLASLFFVSLGLLIDLRTLPAQATVVAGATALIVVVKAAVATSAFRLAGAPLGVAAAAGLALSQIGEFSFVVSRAGVAAGLIDASVAQVLLVATVATMVVTPWLVDRAGTVRLWLGQRMPGEAGVAWGGDSPIPRSDHVVVLGFGLGGQLIARALAHATVPYVAMELNGRTVQKARAAGIPVVGGDALSEDTLASTHVARARAVVVLLSDVDATARVIRAIRRLAPDVPVLVRTRYRLDIPRMESLGASVAVAEEIEASLEVLTQLLERLGVNRPAIDAALVDLRHREAL